MPMASGASVWNMKLVSGWIQLFIADVSLQRLAAAQLLQMSVAHLRSTYKVGSALLQRVVLDGQAYCTQPFALPAMDTRRRLSWSIRQDWHPISS